MKTEGEDARDSGSSPAPFLKPKFKEIAELISNDGEIHSGETRAQRAAGDNAKLYTRIEKDLHGNKDAAKAVRRLVKMDQSHRDDFLRTFEGLCNEMKLWPPEDLVDQAEGKGEVLLSGGDRGRPQAVIQTAGVDYEPESDEGGEDADDAEQDDDDGEDAGEEEAGDDAPAADAAPDSNVTPFRSALDKSRTHFGATEPTAPKAPRKPRGGKNPEASVH